MEAGLDGALFGAGGVAVGQSLEGPLAVLVMEVISGVSVSLLLWGTVSGRRGVSGGEVDFRNCSNELLHSATLSGGG